MTDLTVPEAEAAVEKAEEELRSAEAKEAPAVPLGPTATGVKYLDMGPGYLGPTAVNGT